MQVALTIAIKCRYYFRYSNYKLKAPLADKTSGCYIGYISDWLDQFRYIKILPKTIDFATRLWEKLRRLWGLFPRASSRGSLCEADY